MVTNTKCKVTVDFILLCAILSLSHRNKYNAKRYNIVASDTVSLLLLFTFLYMTDYDKQASDFLATAKIKITKTYTGFRPHFVGDTVSRDTYMITIERTEDSTKRFSFDFGNSTHDTDIRKFPDYQSYLYHYNNKTIREKQREPFGKVSLTEFKKIKAGPSDYNLLSCLGSDSYQHDTLQDFCDSYGYDTDSRKALDMYLNCQEQSSKINRFFTSDELEQLREIQ